MCVCYLCCLFILKLRLCVCVSVCARFSCATHSTHMCACVCWLFVLKFSRQYFSLSKTGRKRSQHNTRALVTAARSVPHPGSVGDRPSFLLYNTLFVTSLSRLLLFPSPHTQTRLSGSCHTVRRIRFPAILIHRFPVFGI